MAWARLDDGFPEHPKVLAVGPFGLTVFVRALCYSARNLTDGFIPNAATASFTVDFARTSRAAHAVDWPSRLVAAGLWDEAPGGYRIHDYLAYNPSKEKVLAERKAAAERVKRWRADPRNAKSNTVTSDERNGVTNGGVTVEVTPPPSPSPPLPLVVGEELRSSPTPREPAKRATAKKKPRPPTAHVAIFEEEARAAGLIPAVAKADAIQLAEARKKFPDDDAFRAAVRRYLQLQDKFLVENSWAGRFIGSRLQALMNPGRTSDTAFPPTKPIGTKYANTPTVRI